MNGFEGSFGGHSSRLDAGSVLECGVCWWIYDPALGDDSWQVPAGTAFADLPSHWRCPNCDNPPQQFMVVQRERAAPDAHRRQERAAGLHTIEQRERELLQAYSAVSERMRTLPVFNHKLNIQVIGLRRWGQDLLGIAATPWCMNVILLPVEDTPGGYPGSRVEGTAREVEFPSGHYSFIAGQLNGVGPVETCSLFSPMGEFDDPDVVRQVAEHALAELLRAPTASETAGFSRRGFLKGGGIRSRDKLSP